MQGVEGLAEQGRYLEMPPRHWKGLAGGRWIMGRALPYAAQNPAGPGSLEESQLMIYYTE